MIVDKLYTLSQFVDLINTSHGWQYRTGYDGLKLIFKYNLFLKQPLTKDMFVCDLEKPLRDNFVYFGSISPMNLERYKEDLGKYEAAQKKVIFGGFMKSTKFKYAVINGTHELAFDNAMFPRYVKYGKNLISCTKTLHDLAEATNGELKLKNVEL